ncbi:MAG: hypothetical protein R3F65_10145 [bacterium]
MARSRFRRTPARLPPLRLTPRDDELLRDIARLGCCLVPQLQALHFPSYKTAAERAMKLFHHRFLDRLSIEVENGQPAMIHVIGPEGRARLRELGVAAEERTPGDAAALARAVAVAEVLTAFLVAGRRPGVVLPLAEAGPPLDGDGPVQPDAGVVIDVPARLFRRVLLIDVERDERDAAADERRARRYGAWRQWAAAGPVPVERALSRMLARRGVADAPGRARVSIGLVVRDAARLDVAAREVSAVGCGPLFHLTTVDALRAEGAFAPVWVQARARLEKGDQAARTSVLE